MDSLDKFFQPLPKSSSILDDGECMAETLHEFSVMQGHNATNTCNNLQDGLLDVAAMGDPDMYCAGGCWPDDIVFGRCEHASYEDVETDNASNMECCSLDMIWESWLQATSMFKMQECVDVWEKWSDALGQSQAPDADGVARRDHSRVKMENAQNMEYCSLDILKSSVIEATGPSATTECCSNIWQKLSEATTQYSEPPSNDHMSPSANAFPVWSFSSQSSAMPSLANANALLTHVYQSGLPLICSSTCQQYDSYPLDYINNHISDPLDIDKGMLHDNNAENSMGVSFSPSFDYGNIAPMMYRSASAACGDDFSDAAIAISPSPQQLCFAMSETTPPPPNLAARAIQSQLYLEARPKQALSDVHRMDETRAAIKDSGTCEVREIVTFLVESSTPAIDDGYKWCKYGQKNIKDKLHPRCYFKCAQRHCPVKKQAEGSSSTPGFVLITYFGKHNHYNQHILIKP